MSGGNGKSQNSEIKNTGLAGSPVAVYESSSKSLLDGYVLDPEYTESGDFSCGVSFTAPIIAPDNSKWFLKFQNYTISKYEAYAEKTYKDIADTLGLFDTADVFVERDVPESLAEGADTTDSEIEDYEVEEEVRKSRKDGGAVVIKNWKDILAERANSGAGPVKIDYLEFLAQEEGGNNYREINISPEQHTDIAFTDYLLDNVDRHFLNMLYTIDDTDKNNKKVTLLPIDHGLSLLSFACADGKTTHDLGSYFKNHNSSKLLLWNVYVSFFGNKKVAEFDAGAVEKMGTYLQNYAGSIQGKLPDMLADIEANRQHLPLSMGEEDRDKAINDIKEMVQERYDILTPCADNKDYAEHVIRVAINPVLSQYRALCHLRPLENL